MHITKWLKHLKKSHAYKYITEKCIILTLTFDQKMTAEQKHGQSLAQFSEQKLAGHPAPQKGLQTQWHNS